MENTPVKLIRDLHADKLDASIVRTEKDPVKLNKLFELKILEEVEEIKNSGYNNVYEFVDLLEATNAFIRYNCDMREFEMANLEKLSDRGGISNKVLTDLNPNNPSNKIYFKEPGLTITDRDTLIVVYKHVLASKFDIRTNNSFCTYHDQTGNITWKNEFFDKHSNQEIITHINWLNANLTNH